MPIQMHCLVESLFLYLYELKSRILSNSKILFETIADFIIHHSS